MASIWVHIHNPHTLSRLRITSSSSCDTWEANHRKYWWKPKRFKIHAKLHLTYVLRFKLSYKHPGERVDIRQTVQSSIQFNTSRLKKIKYLSILSKTYFDIFRSHCTGSHCTRPKFLGETLKQLWPDWMVPKIRRLLDDHHFQLTTAHQ